MDGTSVAAPQAVRYLADAWARTGSEPGPIPPGSVLDPPSDRVPGPDRLLVAGVGLDAAEGAARANPERSSIARLIMTPLKNSVLALACTLGIGLAAGGPVSAQTLRWASQGDLQTLDPYSQNELLTNSINGQVYESLLARNKNMEIVPALATEWQQIGPTLWRITLRGDVKFHDGQPFSADDVVFSVERARDKASGIRVYAAALGEVRKTSPLSVEILTAAVLILFSWSMRPWCRS